MAVQLRFLGCGDAFGSGGRLHTCFHLAGGGETLLVDCGATSLQALKGQGIDPAGVAAIALTHLHGDHFGGVPWLAMDGRFSGRTKPLVVSGPVGTERRIHSAWEALYPGGSEAGLPFELHFVEYGERRPITLADARVTPFEVIHQSGAPSYGLRTEYGGQVIAYSGDTEWTDSLIELARGADLFICECNFYDRKVPGHLDFRTFQAMRDRFDCGRLVLTHLSAQMLERVDDLDVEAAYDGLAISIG